MEVKVFDNSLKRFIESLEVSTHARVLRTINLLEKFSSNLRLPHSKKVIDKVFELRIRSSQEVRIFYTFHKAKIILLSGFIKKSNKIPKKEIKIALQKLKQLD